jgi:hypothetical protein
MAEEKYIFAFEVDNKDDLKDNLPECNGCVCFPCDETCIGRKKAISRQEAIKKIETHLKASTMKFSTTHDVVAEISLNALLEGK